MKRPRFTEAQLEPSRWVWLRARGNTYALSPDAYAQAADIVADVPEKSRGPVPHAFLVMFVVNELVQRGWMRFEVERTATGRRRPVIKLVPLEERPQQPAKRARRKRVAAAEPQPAP